jgi:hypothetical protein
MYGVMIWVHDGLITIPTTLIICSHNIGFANLERHTNKRDDVVKLEPYVDKILYPYNRPVWPQRRNTVKLYPKLIIEEDLQWKKSYHP